MIVMTDARYESDHTVWVAFADGVSGVVDLSAELWGEMFEPLNNVEEFRKLKFDPMLRTVVWPNGADFAPEFFYAKLRNSDQAQTG